MKTEVKEIVKYVRGGGPDEEAVENMAARYQEQVELLQRHNEELRI